jgi:hypothetical protein
VGKIRVGYRGKPRCGLADFTVDLLHTQTKRIMDDLKIMSMPEWDEALDESITQFKKLNRKEPTLVELQNIIEVLIKRFRAVGMVMQEKRL